MILKFLLPRQLVAEPAPGPDASPYAGALPAAFRHAYPALVRAAWWSLPISLFALLPSIFILQVYNRVIYRGGMATLVALVGGVLCFLALEYWTRLRRARALRNAGATIDHDISESLLASMTMRPLRALEERPATAWFMLFRDIGTMRATLTGGLMSALFDMPMALFSLVVIAVVALPVLPVVVAGLAIMAFFAWWWADEVRDGKVEENERARDVDRVTAELCRARETVKVLGADAAVCEQWRGAYREWLVESFRKNGELEAAREGSTVLMTLFSVAVITMGAIGVTQQWMTIGSLMAINLLASKAISPVARLAANWRALARANEAAARLDAVLAEPVERAAAGVNLPAPRGRLRLSEVTFGFDGAARPVLERVSLDLGPGGIHAIVGHNGAGKSTLAKLMAGLYVPEHGKVLLDEYDLAQFSRAELVRWIGVLAQDVYWFSGAVIDALRRSAPDLADEQIVAACRLAGVHEAITRLPAGYQTRLGEDGAGLSAGERRKLALAQLFLRSPAVLLLDEPSNDLDFHSETVLINALRAVARSRTVIVVTHSLRLAAAAQRIYHVPGNATVEQGTPAELLPRLFGAAPRPAAEVAGETAAVALAKDAA